MKMIISYGMPKSASTFAWLVIKKICLNSRLDDVVDLSPAAKGNDSVEDYIDGSVKVNAAQITREVGERCCVIKTHSSAGHFRTLVGGSAFFQPFAQHRDPRDVALSLMDHARRSRELGIADYADCLSIEGCLPVIDSSIENFIEWVDQYSAIPISYDYLCFNGLACLSFIASALDCDVDCAAILKGFERKESIAQFNKGIRHRWVDEMPQAQARMLFRRYEEYYDRFGA